MLYTIQMLKAISLKLIKQRVSLHTNLKDEIKFLRSFGAPEPIKYLNDALGLHYTSNRAISEIVNSLDLIETFRCSHGSYGLKSSRHRS